MSGTIIGWYVHHHGHGHLARFLAVRPRLDADVVCFSSLPAPATLPERTTWIRLAPDADVESLDGGAPVDPAQADPTASGLLHWAPLGHAGHRSRLARIAAETAGSRISAFVVDVSVEVTFFVRLLGVPVVLVAQPGLRDDDAHRLAYRAATRILAPWPAGAPLQPGFPPGADVVHTGGISRFDGLALGDVGERTGILVLLGAGGGGVSGDDVAALTASVPDAVTVLGGDHDWIPNPWSALTAASVVVSFAGQNSVADVAAAGARALVIPQARPFDEQVETARGLEAMRLAVVEPSWPEQWRWPDVLDRVRSQDPEWSAWQTDGAAERAAGAILDTASRWLP